MYTLYYYGTTKYYVVVLVHSHIAVEALSS
jgi:hypothetical protein